MSLWKTHVTPKEAKTHRLRSTDLDELVWFSECLCVEDEFLKPDLDKIHQWIGLSYVCWECWHWSFWMWVLCQFSNLQYTSLATAEDSLHTQVSLAVYNAKLYWCWWCSGSAGHHKEGLTVVYLWHESFARYPRAFEIGTWCRQISLLAFTYWICPFLLFLLSCLDKALWPRPSWVKACYLGVPVTDGEQHMTILIGM